VDLPAVAQIATGSVVLTASVIGARHDKISETEQRVFRAVNGLPDALFIPLWGVMQLGNLAVGTALGAVVAVAFGELDLVLAVLAAAAMKLVIERVVRARMARFLAVRQRPGTSQPHVVLRGADVPAQGPSFPSGHVILAVAVAGVLATALPTVVAAVAFTAALLVMLGRVYVGAHNPLDVTAGLGAGLVVGGVCGLVLN
jgi:membrane-associated phospholipid phosphatase